MSLTGGERHGKKTTNQKSNNKTGTKQQQERIKQLEQKQRPGRQKVLPVTAENSFD
jgi:hypothetical protein